MWRQNGCVPESIAYVGDLPKFDIIGGVLRFTLNSGTCECNYAMPLWLARLAQKRVGDLIAEADAAKAA
jgi:hypothetical protein